MPDLATIHAYNGKTSEAAANVQLSIVRLSNLTKRKSSWKLKTHSDPCGCSATLSIEISSVFFPKNLRHTPLDRHRLPTDAGFKAGPPLDLSFWSFLTFLHHGIEEVERHLL